MAFPWLAEEGFELGTRGDFDAETDTGSRLDFAHYSTLAGIPGLPAPYRGAYCMRVDLGPSTADAYVQETGDYDTSASGSIWGRFQLYVSNNIVMANNDEFAIMQLWSGTNTVEASIVLNYTTTSGLRIGIGESTGSQFLGLTTGTWHTIEWRAVIDAGGANDGTIDLWVDGGVATQVTGLDQAAITSAVFGVIGQDAGTTRGMLLFDDIMADDLQIYFGAPRFPQVVHLTDSGHVFVGQGEVEDLTVIDNGSGNSQADIYDTDRGDINDVSKLVASARSTTASERNNAANMPITVQRGCYVSLTGTSTRALVKIGKAQGYWSDVHIRNLGARRGSTPGNT